MTQLLAIALAGAAGTLARLGLSTFTYQLVRGRFPSGTLAVNLLGCLVIGILMEFARESVFVSATLRSTLTIGFLGAFTTFSTFSYETLRLLEEGAWVYALANVGISVVGGLGAVWCGVVVVRVLTGAAS